MNIKFDSVNIYSLSEGIDVEFKKCENKVPRSMWETYSAFSNTFGGTIILGIDETSTDRITGVSDSDKIIQDIWDILNNTEKISCNTLVDEDIEVISVEGKELVIVNVPRAKNAVRPIFINNNLNNGSFRRNGEGDYHCSLNEIKEMLRDASDSDEDLQVIDAIFLDELNKKSIEGYRNRLISHRPDHPWCNSEEKDFLRLIGAARNGKDGELHPTAAGLLMFGEECSISQAFPNYRLDYLEYLGGTDWTDRFTTGTGMWTGNIFDFLVETSRRLDLHSKHPLEIKGMNRVEDSDLLKAERELLLNGLAHADYHGRGGIQIELHPDRFCVTNPGSFRIPFGEAENGGTSDPRNPTIMKMLKLVGYVENAGSGIRRIFDICRKYQLVQPTFEEKVDPMRTVAEIYFLPEDHEWDIDTKIKRMMAEDGSISMDAISERIGVSRSTVYRTIEILKSRNEIARIGGKRGKWEVTGYR